MTDSKKPNVIELIKLDTPYRLWCLSQPGPPPGWDWKEEQEKARKARLKAKFKLVKKKTLS